ncbi:MAG: hypothetical protein FJY88_07765 [Candidatus Eisenbacteria bacterium]|nr:hypothetical protein [Candidatus Eisenbacteria bacterium]
MRVDGRTALLGLVGNPITHTLSPRIQNHALERLGENVVYLPFEIDEPDLEPLIELFPRLGGIGLNVTTPFKVAAGRFCSPGDEAARLTGVVNTIVYREGEPVGFGTDGRGFRAWMSERAIRPAAAGIVLLGFGATCRGIAHEIGSDHALSIVTRSPERAIRVLEGWFAEGWAGMPARVLSWKDPIPEGPSLVVGGLPSAFSRSEAVASWLAGVDPACAIVDLNYGAGRTPLRDQARDRGLATHDGLGLLVHQAALSLSLWLGSEVSPLLLAEPLAGEAQ